MTTVQEDIAALRPLTEALLVSASGFSDADLAAESLCEGWSRGHVLSHIARNADAIGRLARWARSGEREEMYAGGTPARDAEIEAGSGRSAAEQLADLRRSARELDRILQPLSEGVAVVEVEGRGGFAIAAEDLPYMRMREVVFHHVDLCAGYTFADVDPDLLRRFLDDAVARLELARRPPSLALRTDEGDEWTVGEGAAHVRGPRAGMLLWLARRIGEGVRAEGALPGLPRGA